MKYGILSDIHGNLEALEACLEALVGTVDGYLCAGDIVGYGANPNECCDRVRQIGAQVVMGNHDLAASTLHGLERFNAQAGTAARWAHGRLAAGNREWLAALPLTIDYEWGCLVHGTPVGPEEFDYLEMDWQVRESLDAIAPRSLCVVGHSHCPGCYCLSPDAALEYKEGAAGLRVSMEPGWRYALDCGSVGQPRDDNPDAACAVLDTDAGEVRVLRVPYAVEQAQGKIRKAGLPRWLADRLSLGA